MDLPVTIDLDTDTASFLIYDPEDLSHRWSDDPSWCFEGDAFAVEARAGRLLGWHTGSDGEWGVRLTDRAGELPLVPGRSADYLLEVRHGRLMMDDGHDLPNRLGDPQVPPHESRWFSLPNGRYRVRVSLVDAVPGDGLPQHEVLFSAVGETGTFAASTEIAPLRATVDTLGRVVNAWTAHPDDPVVSAYERWLIALDSGDSVASLPNASWDGTPAAPPTPPRRTSASPTAAESVDELRQLIADVGARGLLDTSRRNSVLAGRLLSHAGLAGWLREYLPLTDDEKAYLDAQSRQVRFDALLTKLRELAATPAPEAPDLGEAEQRLLRPVPALDAIELAAEPVIVFRDPPGPTLPGATLELTVPAELVERAATAAVVALVTTIGVDPTTQGFGFPGTLASVRQWDPVTSTLTVEAFACIRCHDPSVADQPTSTAEIKFSHAHRAVSLPLDVAELKALIAQAAERDPAFAVGPAESVPADRIAEFQTNTGVAEWLLRALPMRPALRLDLYAAGHGAYGRYATTRGVLGLYELEHDVVGPELVAQLRALADPTAVTQIEAELLTVRPWLTAVPPGPLPIVTGAAHLPGAGDVVRDQTPRWAPYALFSPAGLDGDLGTLNELVTSPIPGPPGHFEHRRRHLGIVRISRTYIGANGLVGLAEPVPEPPDEDVEDVVEPSAVATFVADRLELGSGVDVTASWDIARLHSARAVSAWLLRELRLEPQARLTLAATPPRERLHLLLDHLESHADPAHRIARAERPAGYPAHQALVESQPGPARSEVPLMPTPVFKNEDVNFVIGDRSNVPQSPAAWPEVSGHRHAVWAGRAADGAYGLLLQTSTTDPATRTLTYDVVGLVAMSEVGQRPDGGFHARLAAAPRGPAGDLDGVVDRAALRDLLDRAAARDPEVATGWRRPAMRAPQDVADLAFHEVAEDLLRRLPMPLSARTELITRSERDRLQILVDQLRDIADGVPPEPETAQRLDRPLLDLPPDGIPVLTKIWLTPGAVSTLNCSAFISDRALAMGWAAVTNELAVGRAVMATRPLHRSDAPDADGWYALTTDQIRPAIIRAVVPGEAGRSYVELDPAPSAAEAAGQGLPAPDEEAQQLSAYLQLLDQAYARATHVLGTASGTAFRLWQAHRFTSLRALMSWQIGRLGFSAQSVIDLQAISWPDRLRALSQVLQAVVDGQPLNEATAEAAQLATAALTQT